VPQKRLPREGDRVALERPIKEREIERERERENEAEI